MADRAPRAAAALLLGVVVAGAGRAAAAPAPAFHRKAALSHVRVLSHDIGVRVRGTTHELRAARYVAGTLADLGYRVRIQRFRVDGGRSRNVVAWWPGADALGIVLGGHIDTVRGSPGANDNASGVAVILELARLLAGTGQAGFLRFVAFGSEEYSSSGVHHVGSQTFVDRLGRRGRRRLAGMASIDMIADGRPLIAGTAGIGPPLLARVLVRTISRAGIRVRYRVTCDCSDNGPFERAGIPSAFMWSGDETDYHSPSDTIRNLSPRDLDRTGEAMLAFAWRVDRALIRRLRSA